MVDTGGYTPKCTLLSINIGSVRTIGNANVSGQTGIYKLPVAGPVQVTADGLANDAIVDTKNHGGPDQAVYVYGGADYAWWSAELGRELAPGTFGENLTITDLESAALAIGDRLHIGGDPGSDRAAHPVLEAGAADGRSRLCEALSRAERPGVYCRVVREGNIRAGEPVTLEPYAGERVTVTEVFRDYYEPARDPAAIRRFLAAPLAIRARTDKEQQLREAERKDRKR